MQTQKIMDKSIVSALKQNRYNKQSLNKQISQIKTLMS